MANKKGYVVLGISNEMIEQGDLTDDIQFFKNEKNEVLPVMALSWVEAFRMRIKMAAWFFKTHYKFGLRKI